MPQYCFQFFRCCPARIAEVNFVVAAVPCKICLITLFPRKSGRPVAVTLTRRELDKLFKRIV